MYPTWLYDKKVNVTYESVIMRNLAMNAWRIP